MGKLALINQFSQEEQPGSSLSRDQQRDGTHGCRQDERVNAGERRHAFLRASLTYSWAGGGGGQLDAEGKGVLELCSSSPASQTTV